MTPPNSEIGQSRIQDTADALADAARAAVLPLFRSAGLATDNKLADGFDPVTEADRAAERAMREILADRHPDDGILGEEYGHAPGRSGRTWVLDPIDGTRGFLCGTPTWGVLIALSSADRVLYGVIDQPFTKERFCGGLGRADVSGPQGRHKLRVRQTTDLADARLMTTFPEIGMPAERTAFERVATRTKLTRYGMDCYAYALLATGQIDLVIEAGLNAYDIQAPIGVIEAAGGIVTNWDGGPALHGGTVLAAATPELHRAAQTLLMG
ncbi:Histidinol-phosphatase [Roseivivax sp. THAF40]|uniref:histidinol-phosphatase n=1 Tax=unclassified Roseivivax TaxID=2639302 RepID=UPI0012691951|nr:MULTISPECIES: histidinol-phosphatase [unclassified Roseivivax]QFS82306.1 Histidinol-phosphatase [Roseivivax sp. THAF197b]QFT46097.1 Histidinol-phosphatase [Roseivivax sp. THAF40]